MTPADRGSILLVDDESINLLTHGKVLRDAGYVVTTASGRDEAFAVLAESVPDLILLDIRLGAEDGIAVMKEIKADPRYRFVAVVLITGQLRSSVDTSVGLESGADGYVTRPIQPRELLARVEAFVRHKRTVDALRQSEERFRKIIERNPDAILIVDREGRIRFANPASEDLFKLTVDELLSRVFGYPVVKGEHTEIRVHRKLEDSAVAEMRTIDIDWEDGPAFLTSIRDITERVQLEEKLRQAQKMEVIGQLAGGVAHDFNNILGGIMGYADLLRQRHGTTDGVAAPVAKILAACERAGNLTRQLLTFSRKSPVTFTDCDVHDCIRRVVGMLQGTIARTIAVRTDLQAPTSTLRADGSLIESTLLNLAINARDAMPDGGTLTFSTRIGPLPGAGEEETGRHDEQFLVIAVEDTGIGMDAVTRCRIFEPFFTTKEVGKGTGLGLSSVYGAVRQHGGHVRVDSEPGHGTSFKVYLRLVGAARPQAPPPLEPVPTKPAGALRHIMLIDDEEFIYAPAQAMLEHLGYTVSCCCNGLTALEQFRQAPYDIDLVIMDLNMPEMDGFTCMRELQRLRPDVRILASSGFADGQTQAKCLSEGAVAFIRKPFRFADLANAVIKALRGGVPAAAR